MIVDCIGNHSFLFDDVLASVSEGMDILNNHRIGRNVVYNKEMELCFMSNLANNVCGGIFHVIIFLVEGVGMAWNIPFII